HAGAHRPVQEEVRQRAGDASQEEVGEEGGRREEGSRRQAQEEEGSRQGLTSSGSVHSVTPKRRAAGRGTLRPFSFHGARGGRSGTPERKRRRRSARARGGISTDGGRHRPPDHFSRAATRFKPSSSRSTRSRPWFASRPSRFI